MNNITRIVVTPSAATYSKTSEIINRANIQQIVYLKQEHPEFPPELSKKQRYEYLKETLVLTTRKTTPFITTFASPGKIVEDIGTILTLNWHCLYNCQFCYLIGSMYQRQWQEAYVNFDDLEHQIAFEKFVHWSILTIWSLISSSYKEKLFKIPKNFKVTADWMRMKFIKGKINSDRKAKAFLRNNLDVIFLKLDIINSSKSTLIRKIASFYKANQHFLPWLNVSEYTDFLAIDPITNFSSDLIHLLENHPEIQIGLRTKSANVESLLKYNATGRIKITINLNTQNSIDNYELGTASLRERLEAAKKIQKAKGFLLKIVIEPIMVYEGYVDDYLNLIDLIKKEINLSKVVDFSFGSVRYKTKLKNLINDVIPNNNLTLSSEILIDFPKDRIRYEESLRKDIYKKITAKLKRYKKLIIRLAAETPEMWDELGLDKEAHISRSVSQ